MNFKPKLWVSLGVVALAAPATTTVFAQDQSSTGHTAAKSADGTTFAQLRGAGGEGGESGEAGAQVKRKKSAKSKVHKYTPVTIPRRGAGGKGGEGGEGGERGARQLRQRHGPGGEGGEGGEAGVNTRYIFGFTEGADTERKGELEIENDTIVRAKKREGSYTAVQNKTEFEYGITNDLMVAFGGYLQAHRISAVPDLENISQTRFDGFFGELKYRFLDRRNAPFGFALSVEPELRLHSETSGQREKAYGVELKAYFDKELVTNSVFVAATLLYEPEAVKSVDSGTGQTIWEHESTFSVSGAITAAIAPSVFLGAEVRHLRKFQGLGLDRLEGQATFVGPTLSVRLAPRTLIQAAYSAQVAGRAVDDPDHRLDLSNFEKHNARLRFVHEF